MINDEVCNDLIAVKLSSYSATPTPLLHVRPYKIQAMPMNSVVCKTQLGDRKRR